MDETKTRAYANPLRVGRKQILGPFEWFSQLALILRTVEGLRTPIALRSASARMARCSAKARTVRRVRPHVLIEKDRAR